ncbi:hypothetical protein [Candidatus Thiosymbion oneisti]|uniref:hypothetical protein n=1 Tax=Candidatus Thiosymbion oneisti TaxID=589554 RepID=UPI000B7CD8DC|nr:hypothetical protein [Candidatus Thiosymbion oneisti]
MSNIPTSSGTATWLHEPDLFAAGKDVSSGFGDAHDLMPKMIFEPLQGVGPFRFGEMIEPLVDKLGLIGVPEGDDDVTGWIGYTMLGQDIRIYSEDGKIVSIACYEDCWYKGRNLIGSTLQDVVWLLGPANLSNEPNVIEIDDAEEVVYEIESVEVQLWIRDGVIVTVFCSPEAP